MKKYIIIVNGKEEKEIESLNLREAYDRAVEGTGFNEGDCEVKDVIDNDDTGEGLVDEVTEMVVKKHPTLNEGEIEMSVRELLQDIYFFETLTRDEIDRYVIDGLSVAE